MKKLIALSIILLPLVAMAQKSIGNFFEEYSESPNYSSIAVTEDMFKMFESIEDADPDMVEFLSKLKFVRYLEYEGGAISTGITVTSGKGKKEYTTTYYVDGKKVNTSKGKSTGIASASDKKNSVATLNLSKSIVYDRVMNEVSLIEFTQLMKTNQDGEKMVFLKKEWTSNDKEFLMLNGNKLIHIRGDINIMHLYQLEEILNAIGEILEF